MNYSKNYQEDQLLAISGLQHIAFCERQWALIHIEQQWDENLRTAEGRVLHGRVHDPEYKTYKPGAVVVRGMTLQSLSLGLYGVADVVEFVEQQGGVGISLPNRTGLYLPRPVEYKRGKSKQGDYDRIQLCAQAMCLEEMLNCHIEEADLYYGETRRRETVKLDTELRDEVIELSQHMHKLHEEGITPKPDMKLSVCKSCSMINICMPRIRLKTSVQGYWNEVLKEL
ncbi:CRISPR-associated protein Cas4 [Syntrophomonas zehnderi]|uniref:CRISPR-associated protein Cas4 n=1 Tax=Syntrophomonas zehnderi TaxID=404335 RepID=UPI00062654BB|nr:CRISPR-associated protein Cas4 [Syntrophomonas zehnderi]